MSKWPKLSETLPHRQPGQCQNCGLDRNTQTTPPLPVGVQETLTANNPLTYWQECDDNDQPERAFIALCRTCSGEIIERHPRLYREQSAYTPMPGAMPICLDCKHRDKMDCKSPTAMFNGGPGLKYEPEGQMVHLCRSPRRLSGWTYMSTGPVEKCSGKELVCSADTT